MNAPLYRCTVCGSYHPFDELRTDLESEPDLPQSETGIGDRNGRSTDAAATKTGSEMSGDGTSATSTDTENPDTSETAEAMDVSVPDRLSNVNCHLKFGGCCRIVTMERVPDRVWDPVSWELVCLNCGYETRAWGDVGFGDTRTWECPGCERAMQVRDVRQSWEREETG